MATQVVLLSCDFNFLNLVSTKKALKLWAKSKVEIIKTGDKEIHPGVFIPTVIRLLKSINVSLSKKIPFSKQNIFVRDSYICQYCEKQLTPKNATVDHVLPQSRGGKNSYTNCVTSCKSCNQWKDDKLLSQTNMTLLRTPQHPSFTDFLYMKAKSLGVDMKNLFS